MNGETSHTSLKQMFQGMIPIGAELIQGIVISVGPIRIQIVNDSKHMISRLSTIVPQHLTDHTVSATISDENGTHNSLVTVHNALQVGDRVHLLSLQSGKKYFVLGRV